MRSWLALPVLWLTVLSGLSQPFTQSELATPSANRPPFALNADYAIIENNCITNLLYGGDPEGGPVWFTADTLPADGALTLNANSGLFTYCPNTDFVGSDQFTFVVHETDGSLTATGTVSLGVVPTNGTVCLPVGTNVFLYVGLYGSTNIVVFPTAGVTMVFFSLMNPDPGYVPTVCITNLFGGFSQCFNNNTGIPTGWVPTVPWSTNLTLAVGDNLCFSSTNAPPCGTNDISVTWGGATFSAGTFTSGGTFNSGNGWFNASNNYTSFSTPEFYQQNGVDLGYIGPTNSHSVSWCVTNLTATSTSTNNVRITVSDEGGICLDTNLIYTAIGTNVIPFQLHTNCNFANNITNVFSNTNWLQSGSGAGHLTIGAFITVQ